MIPLRNIKRFASKVVRQPFYALRVGAKRVAAYAAYHGADGRSPLPESVTFYMTHLCNLRCKMCGQWGEEGTSKYLSPEQLRQQLSLDELKNLVDELAAFKPNITLFGGEPLLHTGCVELIKHIHERGMHTLMISNGSLLSGCAAGLVDAGLDELNVSLDGYGELHDEIRGMPGLFEKIFGGLKEVQRVKRERKIKKPLINLQCTMMKDNYTRLDGVLRAAEELGADSVTFHNLIFLSQSLVRQQQACDADLGCRSDDWNGFVFEPGIDVERLIKEIAVIKTAQYPFAVDFYPNLSPRGLREYYADSSYKPSEYPARCVSPWIVAYVFNDGSVRPCLNSTYAFGNTKHLSFKDAWNSEQALRYRRCLKENGVFPACVRCTELYRY
jgi:MoaA/NifB/PqqE/SkfB family radical SAM enzyme